MIVMRESRLDGELLKLLDCLLKHNWQLMFMFEILGIHDSSEALSLLNGLVS
jgi:hypothetical protein